MSHTASSPELTFWYCVLRGAALRSHNSVARISDYITTATTLVHRCGQITLPPLALQAAVAAAYRHELRRSRTAINGAKALGRSGGAACGETSSPRTGTGTRGTSGSSGTSPSGTRDDAPGAVRAPKSRETLARCNGAASRAAGGRCGSAGTSAGSRAGTCSRAVVGARPPIGRGRSTPCGQARGGARR